MDEISGRRGGTVRIVHRCAGKYNHYNGYRRHAGGTNVGDYIVTDRSQRATGSAAAACGADAVDARCADIVGQ